MKNLSDLMNEVFTLKDEIISLRRDIHEHPELSFKEFRTTELIVDYLKSHGIEVNRPTPTGAVGLIRGNGEGKTIALRADIDALPIKRRPTCHLLQKMKVLCMPADTMHTRPCSWWQRGC